MQHAHTRDTRATTTMLFGPLFDAMHLHTPVWAPSAKPPTSTPTHPHHSRGIQRRPIGVCCYTSAL